MFGVDLDKQQGDAIPSPQGLDPSIIISPDTRRDNRIPPGQSRTKKWPILDASGAPRITLDRWELKVWGRVKNPMKWNWKQFGELEQVKVFADFHCVTRWSRLGNVWAGVSARRLVELCGGLEPDAKFVLAHGYDYGWTTNLPVEEFLAQDALVALTHDGEELTVEHGGPARLIVPRLYAWKSAKWLGGLEFLTHDEAGFWERNGYHMNGDPWREERFNWS